MPSQSHADKVISDLKNGAVKLSSSKRKNEEGIGIYTTIACWILLSVDPFIDISSVLLAGMEQGEECDDATLQLYDIIVSLEPKLEEVLQALYEEPSQLQQFMKHLEATINSAKTNDTSSLKSAIGRYVSPDSEGVLFPETKAARGFRNWLTARYLCPIKRLAEFDADPE
ncbi:hypothetical protein C0992_007447 [Termitomyces sp. T32_za158]|nr:hypothetical protein C0992_007447 [Termitomyces sp. T32_za158]